MQLLRCNGCVRTAISCGVAADSEEQLLWCCICSTTARHGSSATIASNSPHRACASMSSRRSSRLAVLLQVASRTLTDGRSGLGGLAAAGGDGYSVAEVLQLASGSRRLHSPTHDIAHASAAVQSVSIAQHSGFPADHQQARGVTSTSAAQEPASPRRRQHEAQPQLPVPSSASRSAPAPHVVQGTPHARASPPSRRATWRPETQQDRAAAALADRMDTLVRSGHPQAAMDLFEIDFLVRHWV